MASPSREQLARIRVKARRLSAAVRDAVDHDLRDQLEPIRIAFKQLLVAVADPAALVDRDDEARMAAVLAGRALYRHLDLVVAQPMPARDEYLALWLQTIGVLFDVLCDPEPAPPDLEHPRSRLRLEQGLQMRVYFVEMALLEPEHLDGAGLASVTGSIAIIGATRAWLRTHQEGEP